MMTTLQWNEATEAIENARSIVVVTHIRPDGDAIGSALGLANALEAMDKQVTVAVDDGVPGFLQFLPGADRMKSSLADGEWDVMISADSSDEERTGDCGIYARAHSKTVINLDHHATNTRFGDIHLVDSAAVSACEIVFNWWAHIGLTLTRDVAVPILTGMVTDTLGFRVSSVTDRTLEIAQKLMAAGASLRAITARTLDSMPYATLELWKRALPSVQLHGQVISAVISQADLNGAGVDEVVDGSLVSLLNQVDESVIAVVFKEQPENEVRLSMRCKLGYDVSEVAYAIGGGGHKQASGATFHGTVDEAQAKVLPLLQEAAAKGSLQLDD